MNYFKNFPVVPYKFTANGSSWALNLTDITRHVIVIEKVKAQITAFHPYVIQDGERPDSVATKVYGSPDFTWVILIVNNIMSLYDWPLTEAEFNRYIVEKYGSQATATAQQFYLTTDGQYVDRVTYYLLPPETQGSVRSAWEDEIIKNEAKRQIRVIPTEFVGLIQAELERAFA